MVGLDELKGLFQPKQFYDFASKTSLQRGPTKASSPNTVPAQPHSSLQPSLSPTLFSLTGWHTFPLQATGRLYQF